MSPGKGLPERYTSALLAIWLLVFAVAIWPFLHYLLWYDELLTFYGATAPDWKHFATGIKYFDFNPPLQYVLVRLTVSLFGNSAFAVRLPFLAAYLGATLVVFWFVRRRAGIAFGLIAVSLLWASHFLPYAAQARPYALVLLFGAVSFVAWTQAARNDRWSGAHGMLAAATAGLILSHCFAPVCMAAVAVGEISRTWERRRWDAKVWWCLLAPLPLTALYVPFLLRPGEILYAYPATARSIGSFYLHILLCVVIPWTLCAAAALLANPAKHNSLRPLVATRPEWLALLAGMLVQVVPLWYSVRAGIPFHERYGIAACAYLAIFAALLLASFRKRSRLTSSLGAFLALLYVCAFHIMFGQRSVPNPLVPIPAGLPVVVANGGRFLLFDRYEPANVVERLYYLSDRSAAIAIRSTVFEEFTHLGEAYPVRSRIMPYTDFLHSHHNFAVIAFSDDAYQDWLLPTLRRSGAEIAQTPGSPWLYRVKISEGHP